GRTYAGRVRLGHVLRVGGEAVAEQLGVDRGTAGASVLELLQHDDGAGLTHDEAVALRVERARGALRVVVPPRERTHRAEAGDADTGDRRLRAAGEHHVGAAQPDRVGALA